MRPGPADSLMLLVELPAALRAAAGQLRAELAPEAAFRMPAHCALFRHLPGPSLARLASDVGARVQQQAAPLARFAAPVLKERMLALPVQSAGLLALRAGLAADWAPMLLARERGVPALHVTLAAGLDPAAGRAALARACALLGKQPFIGRPLPIRALLLVAHGAPAAAPLLRAAFRV